ncbi:putative signal transduction histidine kinase [Actinobacteria bacterium OV320]|nr:putative signal transduction histidine kinase [Actinobacteria bacterium OV320]
MIPSAPLGTDAAAGRPQGLGASAGAGPDQAAAERRFRFELAAHPGSPAQARRLTRARLTGWSVCEDTCDTAALVISELVTNAIVHTASDVVVCELRDGDDLVRIAVRDEGCAPGDPHPSPQRPEEEHGRGLLLVEALCHAWGAQEHGPGLLVWADLTRKADAPRDPAEPCNSLDTAASQHADLGELLDTLDEFHDSPAEPHTGPAVPRNDLGWGSRPKPGPADGPADEDEQAEQWYRAMAGRAARRPHPVPPAAPAATSPKPAATAAAAAAPDGPGPRVGPQWHRTPGGHGGYEAGRDGRPAGHSAGALPFEHGRERGRA